MHTLLPQQLMHISSGDERAFRRMVHHYADRLYQFALNMVKNHHDAEEIISDVFLKVWQLRENLPHSDHFLFYLYKAVKHTTLNYLKKRSRKKEVEADFFHINVIEDLALNPEEMIISKENISNIHAAINLLPVRCRQIFLLVKEEGFSYKQVGELLDISPATVNVQMTIATKKIWKSLDPSLQASKS